MNFFITSILIFSDKVKPCGRISYPKHRKRSIFVFVEKRSFETFRIHAFHDGCKNRLYGV